MITLFIVDVCISALIVGLFYLVFTFLGKKIQVIRELRTFLCAMIFVVMQILFISIFVAWVGN
ncbi:MAG: hypothetical protein IJ566_06735 [Cardiobacteriaceae bacterium]|nr:hypothetical protein [Cardiobacteriaceae bacterium]